MVGTAVAQPDDPVGGLRDPQAVGDDDHGHARTLRPQAGERVKHQVNRALVQVVRLEDQADVVAAAALVDLPHPDGPVTGPPDSGGRVTVQFTVRKGPFGTNDITCGPAQACLISVTQASPSPAEEAHAPISFR